jgi:hypothetical protein
MGSYIMVSKEYVYVNVTFLLKVLGFFPMLLAAVWNVSLLTVNFSLQLDLLVTVYQ